MRRFTFTASASVPVLFPPVYIPLDVDVESYRQMHVDGGAREMVFFPELIEDLDKAISKIGLKPSDVKGEIYVLYNGRVGASETYKPAEPRALSIMKVFVRSLI